MPAPDVNPSKTGAPAFNAVFAPVASSMEKVRERILDMTDSPEDLIRRRLSWLARRPGKMIRPGLLLLSAKACGRIRSIHIELAAVVEMVHLATLLHDDVIDQADLRRGKPTANALWDNTAAVLLGDLLLSRAFKAGVRFGEDDISAALTNTAEEICRGELLQNLHRGNLNLTRRQYMKIIEGKTASLFACSAFLGAAAADASPNQRLALERYGRLLGTAFQITDDLLDLVGSEEKHGKTLGTDLFAGKITLPLIHWRSSLSPAERKAADRKLKKGASRNGIIQQMQLSGSIDYTKKTAVQICRRAEKALEPISESTAKTSFIELSRLIAERTV